MTTPFTCAGGRSSRCATNSMTSSPTKPSCSWQRWRSGNVRGHLRRIPLEDLLELALAFGAQSEGHRLGLSQSRVRPARARSSGKNRAAPHLETRGKLWRPCQHVEAAWGADRTRSLAQIATRGPCARRAFVWAKARLLSASESIYSRRARAVRLGSRNISTKKTRGRSWSVLSELRDPGKPRNRRHLLEVQLQLEGCGGAEAQGDHADDESAGGRNACAPRAWGAARNSRGRRCAAPPRWAAAAEQVEGHDGRRRAAYRVRRGASRCAGARARAVRRASAGASRAAACELRGAADDGCAAAARGVRAAAAAAVVRMAQA